MTVEAIVPVRVRFGKVLRTWTVDVKARCEVTVDKFAGNATAAAGNRGCSVKVVASQSVNSWACVAIFV
uniref:Uncharacterized protein n=1 Tax=Leersia perrieri TaxID=77586 RepID=A0A0D9XNP0_9ORYZ